MPRGGKRAGSGRKAVNLGRTGKYLKRVEAEEILAEVDEKAQWTNLLYATHVTSVAVIGGESGQREQITVPDNKIRLEALKYLTDRRDGKPVQALQHSGKDGGQLRVVVEHIGRTQNPPSA